jgi:hypothetical protein
MVLIPSLCGQPEALSQSNDQPSLPTAMDHRAPAPWLQSRRRQWVVTRLYVRDNDHDASIAKVLTMDEARRMASNFAKLPDLLSKS